MPVRIIYTWPDLPTMHIYYSIASWRPLYCYNVCHLRGAGGVWVSRAFRVYIALGAPSHTPLTNPIAVRPRATRKHENPEVLVLS